MFSFSTLALVLAGVSHAIAGPGSSGVEIFPQTQLYYPPDADCWEYKVPVKVETEIHTFDLPHWTDDRALLDFLTLATTRPSANFPGVISGLENVTDEYTIAASFCTPKNKDTRKKSIILATHGIGQARTHWNSAYEPENYNFVQHAIADGYSVWFYDRLGNGKSEKISGFKSQLRLQKQLLVELTKIVRSGDYNGDFGKPDKLAIMGFSFGSYVTHFALAENPSIADAAILTAINYNLTALNTNGLVRSYVPRIASLQSSRFKTLDPGYLTWVDLLAQTNTYFKYPNYDLPTTIYAEENKEAFSIGEFLTLTDGDFDASGFTGAALAITGEYDYIICDGFCPGIFEEPARTIFRNAKFTPYIHPATSHNFNFHFNATGAFGVITDFLGTNGL